MAQFTFTYGYGRYYPNTGLYVSPGETRDFDVAPDADWKPVDGATPPIPPIPAPSAAPSPSEAVSAAEALLEANPALAEKLVKEAATNA